MPDRGRHDGAIDGGDPVVPGRDPVPVVAEEELVGAFPREHDLDVLAREPRHEVQGYARGVGDRLVLVPDEPGQRLEELGGRHDDLAVLGAGRARCEPRVAELVGLALGKAHGKGADGLLHHRRHQGGQAAGVEPAGEKEAQRHVAHEMAGHGGVEPRAQLPSVSAEVGSSVVRRDG